MRQKEKLGYIYAIGAFTFWGLVPIYFKMVSHISAFEVLANRIIWSVVFLAVLLIITKQSKYLKNIFQNKKQLKMLFLSSSLVTTNWLIFIIAINTNQIVEASFGYFINPLVNILLAYIFLKEKLNKAQSFAVVLALFAVIYQIFTLKSFPFISLALAFSFAFYGLVRKKVDLVAMPGLFIETLLMSPFALFYMFYLSNTNQSHLHIAFDHTTLLLVFAGFITVVPLAWFNAAATKIPYSTLGFIQYIGPTLSFLLAIYLYHEPFDANKFISFVFIWIGLFIYTVDSLYKHKKVSIK